MRIFINWIIVLVSVLTALFLMDTLLGLLGFPNEHPFVYTYNKNQRDTVTTFESVFDFNTNQWGLRDNDFSLKKEKGEKRLLVLGDSFVFGLGVNQDSTFSSLLEQYFATNEASVNVINGGLVRTGPFHYAKLFFNLGLKLNPDGVLICIYANDLGNCEPFILSDSLLYEDNMKRSGLKRIAHAALPRIYILSSGLFIKKEKLFKPYNIEKLLTEKVENRTLSQKEFELWKEIIPLEYREAVTQGKMNIHDISLGFFSKNEWMSNLELSSKGDEIRWQNATHFLSKITDYCLQKDIKIGVVYIPYRAQYDAHFFNDPHPVLYSKLDVKRDWLTSEVEIQKRLKKWTDNKNIPYLDLTPLLQTICRNDTSLRLTFKLDDHFNKEGHALTSYLIQEWVSQNQVFPFLKPKKSVENTL